MFEKISEIVEHIADQEQENESKKKNRKRNHEFPENIGIQNRQEKESSFCLFVL